MKMLSVIYLTVCLSLTANATCTQIKADCKLFITKSDAYIAELKKENEMQQAILGAQDEAIRLQNNKLVELEREAAQWYKDPVNMTLLGAIIGLASGIAIAK